MDKRIAIGAVIAAAVCAAGIAAWLIMGSVKADDPVARIYVDGELYRTVPLSRDDCFTVETPRGSNTITIEDGAVRVSEADCPDKVCVNTGAISGGVIPIICLPHRLEIRVVSSESAGVDAAL